MPRPVAYQIFDLPNGHFAVAATVGSNKTHVRTNLKTRAEVDAAIDELRHFMAAMGAPLIQADLEHSDVLIEKSMLARTQSY